MGRNSNIGTRIGCSALAAALLLSVSSAAHAYDVKRTQSGARVHWNQSSVSYQVDPSLKGIVGAEEVVTTALNSWNEKDSVAPALHALPSANAPQREPGADGVNTIFYKANGFEPAGKALAITILTYDGSTGEIVDADIVVNGKYKFAVLPESTTAVPGSTGTSNANTDVVGHDEEEGSTEKVYDIHHVLAHETGHSLGLNDELGAEKSNVLMYRYSSPNSTDLRAPTFDDMDGITEIYAGLVPASADPQSGCGGATVSPKNPSRSAGHFAFAFSLSLVAFVTLRSRRGGASTAAFIGLASLALVSLPSLSHEGPTANASLSQGQARATVTDVHTTVQGGIFRTEATLSTSMCRTSNCPAKASAVTWGGTMNGLRQEVGGQHAPRTGDAVDVTFQKLAASSTPFDAPFSGTSSLTTGAVRVLTRAH